MLMAILGGKSGTGVAGVIILPAMLLRPANIAVTTVD